MSVIALQADDAALKALLQPSLDENPDIDRWWAEFGQDSGGAPSVWLWLVVPDEVAGTPSLEQLTQTLHEAVVGDGRFWPYIYLRSRSEHEMVKKAQNET